MTIEYVYDPEDAFIRATIRDRFDLEQYKQAMQQFTSGKDFEPTTAALWDMRELDFDEFNAHLTENISRIREEFSARSAAITGFVVPDQLGFGMMRMFQIMAGIEELSGVFYDYEKARAWIIDMVRKSSSGEPPDPLK